MSPPLAAGTRIAWADVPDYVRGDVAATLGSPVVSARTQHGGFSPGAAVRIVCADGTTAFVKACGSTINADTAAMYRAEIDALGVLPGSVPHARLLSAYDDGTWVALVLEDVAGRHPGVPWSETDTALVADALDAVSARRAPQDLPEFAATGAVLDAWDVVAAEPGCVPPELAARLPEMLEHQRVARGCTAGDRLVHWDVRADNVLVRDGQVVLLDWAWACRGAGWLDTLTLALELRIQGGPDADELLASRPLTRDVAPEQLAALVACLAGFWAERAGRPAPPGLPTIRAWQEHCATAALGWLDNGRLWT
jgi:hypothetical protein